MTKSVPKWMQRMIDMGVHPDVIAQRAEQRRLRDREWAVKNKEAKAAHKRAYKAKKKAKAYQGMTIRSMYRPNWKEAPVYYCPELTYRGKA
jgi:type II secretory ATPase GspE/PulE/Tfp pilus assembly ATPase PilB-like protein